MKIFTLQDLYQHLEQLGLQAGDDILVHCGLYAFGLFEGGEQALLQGLQQYLGANSTIVAPTFTLWLPEGAVYTYETPSQRMGQLAETIRLHENAYRSRCPMHNHAGIGPKAKLLENYSGDFSTGPGSDFEFFYEEKFKNIFLGCTPKDSGTFLIHAEAMAQVPYREWITLTRKVQWKKEALREQQIQYFARRSSLPEFTADTIGVKVNLGVLQESLLEKNILRELKLPLGRSYLGDVQAIQQGVMDVFKHNPYATLGT